MVRYISLLFSSDYVHELLIHLTEIIVGFDLHGNAKIFDFGLVKELREELKVGEDLYKNTGRTGTRRYMAPEVVLW